MHTSRIARALSMSALAVACGGSPPPAPVPPTSSPDDAPTVATSTSGTAHASSEADAPGGGVPAGGASAAGGAAEASAGGGAVNGPSPAVTKAVESCGDLGRFPASGHVPVPQQAEGGPKTYVPFIADPFGDKLAAGSSKRKGAKKPPKDATTRAGDVAMTALQGALKACFESARATDPSQSVTLAFEHKPKAGRHEMCVRAVRESGRDDVTKAMTDCMWNAVAAWAKSAP